MLSLWEILGVVSVKSAASFIEHLFCAKLSVGD